MISKAGLSLALMPLGWVSHAVGPRLLRIWAHAYLGAGLKQRIDRSVVVNGPVELHGTRRITLGKRLYIYPGQYWETQAGGSLHIGDGVVLSRGVHLVAFSRVVIGDCSMIGEYASVRDANHRRGMALGLRHSGYETTPIVIGKGVWIGRGVAVLSGVRIGDGAVVAANAVVTQDVEPGAVVGGIPAKPLNLRRASTAA